MIGSGVPRTGRNAGPVERRLSDGRRILYYDDDSASSRTYPVLDARELEKVDVRSELRHDPLEDEWVIVAAHRQVRTHLPPSDECPLCPSTESRLTEIPAQGYDVVVFDNRFPSLTYRSDTATEGLVYPLTNGRCEVISFTDDHDAFYATLSEERLATVGRAMVDRTIQLGKEPGVEYVLCFENRGQEIGVTLHHPHGQVYAYPFVPPRVARWVESALRHRRSEGTCLQCDLVRHELADGARVVARTERFVSFVPYAPRWPFEVHTCPLDHVSELAELEEEALTELMVLQSDVVATFDRLFGGPMPYTAGWFQRPTGGDPELSHLRVASVSVRRTAEKLKYFAGSETLVGGFINDIVPEEAAERLRLSWRERSGNE